MTDHPDPISPTRSPARSYRSAYMWWIMAGVLLGALALTVVVLNATVFTSQAAVNRYFQALKAGDGAAAMTLSQAHSVSESSADVSTALLDGDALKSTVAEFENVEISDRPTAEVPEEFRADHAQEVVALTFTVAGTEHETVFVVDKTGTDWLVFPRWQLHPVPLQKVQVRAGEFPTGTTQDETVATVNGTELPLAAGAEADNVALAVLPPALVSAQYDEAYVHAVSNQTLIATISPTGVSEEHVVPLELELTEAVDEAVHSEVVEALSQCTEQQVLQPTGCPFGYATSNRVNVDSITWTIGDDLQVHYGRQQNRPTIEAITATALLSVEEIDLATGAVSETQHREEFALEADLSVTPTEVSVSPQWR